MADLVFPSLEALAEKLIPSELIPSDEPLIIYKDWHNSLQNYIELTMPAIINFTFENPEQSIRALSISGTNLYSDLDPHWIKIGEDIVSKENVSFSQKSGNNSFHYVSPGLGNYLQETDNIPNLVTSVLNAQSIFQNRLSDEAHKSHQS
jgi:hypothetical protein